MGIVILLQLLVELLCIMSEWVVTLPQRDHLQHSVTAPSLLYSLCN